MNSTMPCTVGNYCPVGAVQLAACPAGSYCAAAKLSGPAVCPAGSFCPAQSSAPTLCIAGNYCPAGSSSQTTCPAGSYCTIGLGVPVTCPAGSYCPASSSAPTLCNVSNYCPAGSSSQSKCPSGSFCATPGLSAPKECPRGNYCPAGSSAPTPCPCGTYATEGGNTDIVKCTSCPITSYMSSGSSGQTDANACSNSCPDGTLSTASTAHLLPCGVESCSVSAALSSSAMAISKSVFSNGTAYACIAAAALVLGAVGYVIYGVRGKEARLVSIGLLSMCQSFALSGVSLASEFLNVFLLFSLGYSVLGHALLILRLLHVLPSGYCLLRLFGMSCCYDGAYGSLLARSHFLENSYAYALVAFLGLVETQFLAYLPWYYSEFAERSRGYPDMWTLRRSFYIKLAQTFGSVVCNIYFLTQKQALSGASSAQALAVKGSFYLNIATSVASALLAALHFFMRSSVLKSLLPTRFFGEPLNATADIAKPGMEMSGASKVAGDKGLMDSIPAPKILSLVAATSDSEKTGAAANPLHHTSAAKRSSTGADTAIDMRAMEIMAAATPPVTKPESLVLSTDDALRQEVRLLRAQMERMEAILGAAAKAPSAAVSVLHIPESKKAMNIRQWILSEIPGIEASTLHALAKQLEKVGISTYGDLVECIRAGGINVADINGYVDTAGIPRLKAAKIITDVEAVAVGR